jgi:uncharacterized membrane protein
MSVIKHEKVVPIETTSRHLSTKTNRITSIDLLRGIVMIIMAIDHVRDYFHADSFLFDPTDLSQTNPMIFLTRWITHFCAPVFVFLSGTSAYLIGQRKSKKELSWFLITRGLWLILLEFTLINFAWFFDVQFKNLDLTVIWALGGSMIVLAALIYLPLRIIFALSLLIIIGHNALDNVQVSGNNFTSTIWNLLHISSSVQVFSLSFFVAYPLLSWIGVMGLGYCAGTLYIPSFSLENRKKILLISGYIAILLFIIFRTLNIYGDPKPWSVQSEASYTVLSLLNLHKYPPSLLFILMTLGPTMLFLAYSEKPLNKVGSVISTYGRVPMFYYLVHLYLIHLLAMLAAELTGFGWSSMILPIWVTDYPVLDGYGFSLAATYLICFVIVALLYPLCKWYDQYKMANKQKWWLSYL